MEIVVGYISALEYWRHAGPRNLGTARQRYEATLKAKKVLSSDKALLPKKGSFQLAGCQHPLQVMVGRKAPRVRTSSFVTHRFSGQLPVSSFVRVGTELIVASPELCFLQLAPLLSIDRLIQVGFELCGTYALQRSGSAVMRDASLTTSGKLVSFADQASGAYGRKKAARAARHVLDGSASPRETVLAMMLTLPYRLGGYGIKPPKLNYRINTPPSMRNRVDQTFFLCDECWPQERLCLEYDSAQYHLEARQQERDARRRNALALLGYTVMTVSSHQVSDFGAFSRLAKQVASRLGKQLRYVDPEFTQRHLVLRKQLLRA